MPMGFLSWLQGHCPAGAPRWGWVAVQLGLFFLASSALLGGVAGGGLVAGTVPVLITGLGQMVLGWQGPWSMAGDLVVWHMVAGGNTGGHLSGLFDYATITAALLGSLERRAAVATYQNPIKKSHRARRRVSA